MNTLYACARARRPVGAAMLRHFLRASEKGIGYAIHQIQAKPKLSLSEPLEARTLLSAPVVIDTSFNYEHAPHAISFTFDQPIDGGALDSGDLTLRNLFTNTWVDVTSEEIAWNSSTNTLTFTVPDLYNGAYGVLPDGNYLVTLLPDHVANANGEYLAGNAEFECFFWRGDMNHDRSVNITDTTAVSNHWQTSVSKYSDGDANYDGFVDITDLVAVSNKWQTTLAEPPGASLIGVTATGSNSIRLTWAKVPGCTGYRIQISETGDNFQFLKNANCDGDDTLSYLVEGLQEGKRYWFRVRAYGNGMDTAYSTKDSAITVMPAPSYPSATAISDSQIELVWANNSTSEMGFDVERSLDGTTNWQPIAHPGPDATSTTDAGLTENTTYYYRGRAVGVDIESAWTTPVEATTYTIVPAPPTGLIATGVSDSQIDLAWEDNSPNETGFVVQRWNGSSFAAVYTTGPNVTSWSDSSGLGTGRLYIYRVVAQNGAFNSAPSNSAQAVAQAPNSTWNTGPIALSGIFVGTDRVDLTWSDSIDGEFGWKIERSFDGIQWAQIGLLDPDTDHFTNSGLPLGPVHYRVRAYKRIPYPPFEANTAYSNIVSVYPPTSVTASSLNSADTIQVSWTYPYPDPSVFRVEAATLDQASSGETPFWPVADVPGSTHTATISGLDDGQTYVFRVLAEDASGGIGVRKTYDGAAPTAAQMAATRPAAPTGLQATRANEGYVNLSWADNSVGNAGYAIRQIFEGGQVAEIARIPSGNLTRHTLSSVGTFEVVAYSWGAFTPSTYDSAPSNRVGIGSSTDPLPATFQYLSMGTVGGSTIAEVHGNSSDPPTSTTIRLTRSNLSDWYPSLTVPLIATGTATLGADYTLSIPTLDVSFAQGQTSVDIVVTAVNNWVAEGLTRLTLQALATPTTSGTQPTTVERRGNGPVPPQVWVQKAMDATEGQNLGFIVRRDSGFGAPLTVQLDWGGKATPGTDYAAPPASVTFAAGATDALVTLSTAQQDDTLVEFSETVVMIIKPDPAYTILFRKFGETDPNRLRYKGGGGKAYLDDNEVGPEVGRAYPPGTTMSPLATDVAEAAANNIENCQSWAFNTSGPGNNGNIKSLKDFAVKHGIFDADDATSITKDDILSTSKMLQRVLESFLYDDGDHVRGHRCYVADPAPFNIATLTGWHMITAYWRNYAVAREYPFVNVSDYHFATKDYDPALTSWSWSDKEGAAQATDTDPETESNGLGFTGSLLSYYMINRAPRDARAT